MDKAVTQGPRLAPGWIAGAAFLLLYVVFDWASYLWPLVEGFNITPWNPQQAVAVALLIWWPSAGLVVFAAFVAADVVVRGWAVTSVPVWIAAIALTGTCIAIARSLGAASKPTSAFETRAGLVRFAAIVTGGSLASAVFYIGIVSFAQVIPTGALANRIANYWVGNTVGLLVTLPLLMSLMVPRARAALGDVLRRGSWWASVGATCMALWIAFGQGDDDFFKFFYLLMLPVVWCSVRFGVAGAVLSANLTQIGLIIASRQTLRQELTVFELQALMAAAAGTALLVGVLVEERARAEAELRKGLKFSAAGQMAAGLAHELGQPLTAMSNYAQASRMLLERQPQEREQLAAAIDRMLAEADRAADVARRLRDFFTSGALAMRMTAMQPLLDSALQAQVPAAQSAGIRLHAEVAAGLPAVWMDPVQIAIVLRNLLANALESAAGSGTQGRVTLAARVQDNMLQVEVTDSGPGVQASQLQTLFDAVQSGKSSGMGVGLSICHSIVEAHGGTIWALPGPGGRFLFSLPLEGGPAAP